MHAMGTHIKRRALWFERNFAEAVRQIAKVALETAVEGTPVDTGKARSNWHVGINSVPTRVIAPHAPGSHLGLGETANAMAAIQTGNAEIEKFRKGEILIANTVPYIGRLNDEGHSPQSSHFIEEAVEKARAARRDQPSLLQRQFKWRKR